MAYFTFAFQDVDKSRIDQDIPYFTLETVKAYISSKGTVYESMKNTRGITTPCCKTMCRNVFNGGSICHGYESNRYLQEFTSSKGQRILRTILVVGLSHFMSREGRVIRLLATTLVPEVYDRLVVEEKEKVGGWKRAVILPGHD